MRDQVGGTHRARPVGVRRSCADHGEVERVRAGVHRSRVLGPRCGAFRLRAPAARDQLSPWALAGPPWPPPRLTLATRATLPVLVAAVSRGWCRRLRVRRGIGGRCLGWLRGPGRPVRGVGVGVVTALTGPCADALVRLRALALTAATLTIIALTPALGAGTVPSGIPRMRIEAVCIDRVRALLQRVLDRVLRLRRKHRRAAPSGRPGGPPYRPRLRPRPRCSRRPVASRSATIAA